MERLIDIKRRKLPQASCVHSNTIEVKQLEGTFFGDLYLARCLNCGVLGSLQKLPEEALNTLQRLS